MLITNVTLNDFYNAFIEYNRTEAFSAYGLNALYDLLEDCSQDMPINLDVIGLCCEFSEYENPQDALLNYDHIETLEELKDHTLVLELENGGIILQDF